MPPASGWMRRSLPRRSLVLPAVRAASKFAGRPPVERRVALPVGSRLGGVVADADVEVAVGAELDVAAGVAGLGERAVPDAGTSSRIFSLAVSSVSPFEREAGDPVDVRRAAGRRVVEVDPAVGGEVRVERHADQAVLTAGVDAERAGGRRCVRGAGL